MSQQATTADNEFLQRSIGTRGFGSNANITNKLIFVSHDPVPELNAKGGRTVPTPWKAVFAGKVTSDWCNPFGTMHGGCAAWLTDELTCSAVEFLSTPDWWGMPTPGGVSLNIDTTYYYAVPNGANLRIVVTIDRISGTLANVQAEFTDADSGLVYVIGKHIIAWRAAKKKSAKL
ncbi:hypothetical protein VHUM_01644 [Vanrija humicola]|uniref:Thioesterase domain-containing protein n=1 Tax=Vanrija humicola TaxID=5417 RepID=A0A7D8V2B7_VANHU|nr:hypothetical protein VHUM_01644 [Vanrija humicola]